MKLLKIDIFGFYCYTNDVHITTGFYRKCYTIPNYPIPKGNPDVQERINFLPADIS
jgi:hypothetical protein